MDRNFRNQLVEFLTMQEVTENNSTTEVLEIWTKYNELSDKELENF